MLSSFEDLFEWQKGTLLTISRERLGEELYTNFLDRFHERLEADLGGQSPLFYPFKRVLLWARRAASPNQ